jgi:hypothetical protein
MNTRSATAGYAAPQVADAFARARQLCEQLDRPLELAVLMNGQCTYHLLAGEVALACKEGKEIIDLGDQAANADVTCSGYALSAVTLFHAGDFVGAKASAERGLSLYRPENPLAPWLPQDLQILGLTFTFRPLAYLGYFAQSRVWRDRTLAQARQRQHTHTLAMVRALASEVDGLVGVEPEHARPRIASLPQRRDGERPFTTPARLLFSVNRR